MISHFNDLFFCQECSVCHNLVVNWTGWCTFWVFVCNHIKIKKFVFITINNIILYNCTRLWIYLIFNFCISKESCNIVFIHQNIQNMWIITWIKLLDCCNELLFSFKIQEYFFVGRTPDCISINNNLVGTFIFINFLPIFQGFNNEIENNFSSFFANNKI